jgi:hypothetical protein
MTRKTTPRRRSLKKQQPRPDYPKRWLERYGRSLTGEEIRLVQAHRGLPSPYQTHLNRYASGLIVELASDGRVKAATRALRDSPVLQEPPQDVPRLKVLLTRLGAVLKVAHQTGRSR